MRKCPSCGTIVNPRNGMCPICDYLFEKDPMDAAAEDLSTRKGFETVSERAERLRKRAVLFAILSFIVLPWPGVFMTIRLMRAYRRNKKDPNVIEPLKREIRNATYYLFAAMVFVDICVYMYLR